MSDKLYNIEPKEFKVLERHEVGNSITYVLEPIYKPTECPNCHDTNFIQHGVKTRKVRDLNEYGKLVGLIVNGHRYRCKNCGSTWVDSYKSFEDSARITNRMHDYIIDKCLSDTFTSISKELDISVPAIEKIFAKYVDDMESKRQIVAPRVLGMDETMLNGIYRGMFVDVENGLLIDMTPDRKLRTVKQWLANLPEKERTECATIDMWGSYKDALTSEMPNVFIVIDKFHVIKHLNEALDTIRKKYTSELSDKERRHIKGNRWLLLRNCEELNESQQIKLHILLCSFPKFKEPHTIKENFRNIYLFSKTRQEAEKSYDEWKLTINDYPEYLAFANMVDNWRTEIFNYFDNRFTNAITESLNNVSKETAAKGRGYNFKVLRAKLLYRNEAAQPAKFAYSIKEVDVVNAKHIKPFYPSNFPNDNVIVVSAGTHIGKLHELLEQDKIFYSTDGKHRLKFVGGEIPHFKRYEGDKNNESK